MQMKCHRCDRLFTPVGSEKHCPDCIAGKPIPKKRTVAEGCGKKFYTNKTNRVICSDYDCEEKIRIERLQTNRAKYRANAKQKRGK